jgi:hypothetical protein
VITEPAEEATPRFGPVTVRRSVVRRVKRSVWSPNGNSTPSRVRFLANDQAQYASVESSTNVALVKRFWKLEGADECPFRPRPQQTVSVLAANDQHAVPSFNR